MTRVKLSRSGMAEMLASSEVTDALGALAEQAAEALASDPVVAKHGAPVEVRKYPARGGRYRSERSAYAVTILHPGAIGMQAKHGVISRVAASLSLPYKAHRGEA